MGTQNHKSQLFASRKMEKTVTAAGAKVTTVSIGAHHATSEEPERVTIKADPAAALGVSFAVGGIVRQVSYDHTTCSRV